MTNAEFASGLRELAEIYEQNPDMPQPQKVDLHLFGATREQYAIAVRAIGACAKVPPRGSSDYFFSVRKTMRDGMVLEISTERSSVCRKVRVVKEVDDWDCSDPILESLVTEVASV